MREMQKGYNGAPGAGAVLPLPFGAVRYSGASLLVGKFEPIQSQG